MTSPINVLGIGQNLKGKLGSYRIAAMLRENIWAASCGKKKSVIIKTAPQPRLENECQILKKIRAHPHIRQLLDEIEESAALVLKRMDDNALGASNSKKLERADVKFIVNRVLDALKTLHEAGFVHIDVKPNNILVNYGSSNASTRFSEVGLGDCGDAFYVDLNADLKDMAKEDGYVIGAAVFRSPEAMLNLKWGTATDIWSFGATLISLLMGRDLLIFKPSEATVVDDNYPTHVLLKQLNYFGPPEVTYLEIADEERLSILTDLMNFSIETNRRTPFYMVQWPEISEAEKQFLLKIIKFDPKNRPTAPELLQDPWFNTD